MNRLLSILIVSGIAIWSFSLWYAGHKATQERNTLCAVLYQQVDRTRMTLGLPGTPGYAYYRGHPEELRLARSQARRQLRELPCGPP